VTGLEGLLLDPLVQYGFMRSGLLAALAVGATSAVLSCLLVVRGQALLGDAISHAVLLGVVLGYLVGGELGILGGAMIVAVATGAAITYVTQHAPFRADTSMGVLFTVAFALGLAIISIVQPRGIDLFHVLFGNVLGVSSSDLVLTVASGSLVVLVVLVGFRAFELWSFDPQLARAMGMRVALMEHVFTALLSAAIVASLQTVGLILVVAMLVIPGATAAMLTSRLATMMVVAAGVGVLSGVAGLYGSFHLDVASGPAIVLVAGACFLAAFLLAPRGVLAGRRHAGTSVPEGRAASYDRATAWRGGPR
jgi:ABC-type Mn2+/Zn2+ transport system permease subunit